MLLQFIIADSTSPLVFINMVFINKLQPLRPQDGHLTSSNRHLLQDASSTMALTMSSTTATTTSSTTAQTASTYHPLTYARRSQWHPLTSARCLFYDSISVFTK
uniref:Uncharacterized protein n=1 Tax=Arundo donax TaxID=35708 RepID=A0A0A9AVS9_ARUDO